MSYRGPQKYPINLYATSQLERNRFVKITAGVPAYTGVGEVPSGYITSRGHATDYAVGVTPLEAADGSFLINLATAVAANGAIFSGANGKGTGLTYTALNRSEQDVPSASTGQIFLVPAAGWASAASSANKIATYGAASFTYTSPTTGDVVYVTEEGIYLQYNGSAWVGVSPVAKAIEAGAAGADVACYRVSERAPLARADFPTTLNQGALIVCAGKSTAETDADSTVTILDGRILSSDLAVCTANAGTTTASLPIVKAVCTAGTLTVTLSGSGGASTSINYIVFRSLDV